MLQVDKKEKENQKLIVIEEEDESDLLEGMSFIEMIHHVMEPLTGLPINDIKDFVRSDQMKEEHDSLVDEFYSIFPTINKYDDSLDTAIVLQGYGFNLRRDEDEKYEDLNISSLTL